MLSALAKRTGVAIGWQISSQRNNLIKMQVAFYSHLDEQEEPDDPIITKDRKDSLPRRQNMPEAARQSRFMVVAPENRGKVRRRILEEFKKEELCVHDGYGKTYEPPDAGVLRDMREMHELEQDMTFDEEEDVEPLNLGRLGLLRQIVHVDKVQKVDPSCIWEDCYTFFHSFLIRLPHKEVSFAFEQ
jgi:hypothetical protein